jgi:hypothetical protein
MSATAEGTGDFGDGVETFDEDIDNIKPIDFGVVFGGGVSFMMQNKGAITVDVRYDLGFTEILDDPDSEDDNAIVGEDGEPLDWKTGTISFLVGYSFL